MVDPRFQKIKEFLPLNANPGIEKGLSYIEMMYISIIVFGLILLTIGFLGCCGAMKQVKLFLTCVRPILSFRNECFGYLVCDYHWHYRHI